MYLSQVPLSVVTRPTTEPTFEEWLNFATTSTPHTGKRKCVKPTAFPCGNTCLPSHTKTGKPTNCKNALEGQAKSHAGWLKMQAAAHTGTTPSKEKEQPPTTAATTKPSEVRASNDIALTIPKDKKILGDPVVSREELKYAGIKPDENGKANLSKDEVDRINLIRNGYKNLDEMLNSPPDYSQDLVIYAGSRVKMTICGEDRGSGSVGFTVDDSYDANRTSGGSPPSAELRDMTRAWLKYSKSNAGDRVFQTSAYSETEGVDRQRSRINMYKKYGFSEPDKDSYGLGIMALDMRKDKSKELHPSHFEDGLEELLYPKGRNK